jgi:hypothetical protein
MSTQDDSIYLRSKLATRRGKIDYGGPGGEWSSGGFIKDGFEKWAESKRPAREGGMEKIPMEKQMPHRGKGAVEDALKVVSDMTDFYYKAKEYSPAVKSALRNKDLQQQIAKGKYAPIMEKVASYMEKVGLGHLRDDPALVRKVGGSKSFKQWCQEEQGEEAHGGRIGMGKKHKSIEHHMAECLEGGMSTSQALESLKKYGKAVYDWLKTNKTATKAIMTSKYLNEDLGTDVPRKIKGYMEMIGLGQEGGARVRTTMKDGVPHTEIYDDFDPKKLREEERRLNSGDPLNLFSKNKRAPAAKTPHITQKAVKGAFGETLGMPKGKCPSGYRDDGTMCRKCPPGYRDDGLTCFKTGKVSGPQVMANITAPRGSGLKKTLVKAAVKHKLGLGRAPSSYASFVKQFAQSHPGPDLMKRAAAAWRSR